MLIDEPEEICISAITYAELIHSFDKSQVMEKNRIVMAQMGTNK